MFTMAYSLLLSTAFSGIIFANQIHCDPSPVCGSDGRLYKNLQQVNCISKCINNPYLKVVKNGECENPCICPVYLQQVCGTDGQTYPNLCQLNCENKKDYRIQLASNSPCTACFQDASKDYNPVCASNNVTYYNKEMFACAKKLQKELRIVSNSECKCICTKIYDPVCGTDGVTYGNSCELRCARRLKVVEVASKGPCIKPCDCHKDYLPVCGNDNNTYLNLCRLNCAKANGLPELEFDYDGECRSRIEFIGRE